MEGENKMERENSQFTPELLRMMRNEEREKFLAALKDGASWVQLYQIRNTIRKLNDMIDVAESSSGSSNGHDTSTRGDEENPRASSGRGRG
jgi:hypothetical protein